MPDIESPIDPLPQLPADQLEPRLESIRGALGASRLGYARRLISAALTQGGVPFEILGTAQREPGGGPPEFLLPPQLYSLLLSEARPILVNAQGEGVLADWLRRHGGGALMGWALPNDRRPSIAVAALLEPGREPGFGRIRVAEAGMEALARDLAPAPWLAASASARRDSERPTTRSRVEGVARHRAPVLDPREPSEPLWGHSPAMVALRDAIRRGARAEAPALILGEVGTEKQAVAQHLHGLGTRRSGPFQRIHCGFTAPEAQEAELFGSGESKGAVARSHGGVLYLEEVCKLSPQAQLRLLDFIQSGECGLGAAQSRQVDVRILVSSTQDLQVPVERGLFSRKLYYALSVLILDVPPLRARRDDIPELFRHWVKLDGGGRDPFADCDEELPMLLSRARWSGNLAQLKREARRVAEIQLAGSSICSEHLAQSLREESTLPSTELDHLLPLHHATAVVEQMMIRRALRQCQGNKAQAARVLQVSRQGLYKKLRRYRLASGEGEVA